MSLFSLKPTCRANSANRISLPSAHLNSSGPTYPAPFVCAADAQETRQGRAYRYGILIICGISFAGKSTLGKALAKRFDYAQVDVDDMKFQLYGHDSKDENLSHADWVRIYDETNKLLESYLQSGKTVIDASRNFRKSERQLARQIATKLEAGVVTVFVDTPEVIAHQRLLENRKKKSRLDVTDKDFEEILQVWEPPTADENPLVFHNGEDIDNWISKNISAIS